MAGPRGRKGDASKQPKPDGQLRLSQMVTTFGPGAMVDLVHRAVVIGGLEHWQWLDNRYESLDDARLRAALLPRLKALSPDLDLFKQDYFRRPPLCDNKDATLRAGIRALEFPRWLVCQGCHRLATPGHTFEPHKDGYVHADCRRKRGATGPRAIPVRFVSACPRGHLSDFPWRVFAHAKREEGVCASPELYLIEGATGDLGKIIVKCEGCGAPPMPMSSANAPLYRCEGESPWLGGRAVRDACDEHSALLVRTASNAYFAQVVSALRLPAEKDSEATRRIRQPEVWKLVQKVRTTEQLTMLMELQEQLAGALKGLAPADVVAAIAAEQQERKDDSAKPLRTEEFEKIVSAPEERPGDAPEPGAEFAAYRIPARRIDLPKGVAGLVIVPELREVMVQVSFSRLDSVTANLQGEYDFAAARYKPAPLTLPSGNQKWLPAAEVRGEGIFVELDEAAVAAWEKRPAVMARGAALLRAFERDPRGEFPGIRYYMLHSLSHLLLTAISLECGYAASAIRERIYCQPAGAPGVRPMAAVMLSTGTTGSEGTLGGLVEEGRNLRHHLREAWELGRLCSNDPVCASRDPATDTSEHGAEGAACHGCLYIAECSCERFNRYLDRALVVPTIGNDPELAFFAERP
jgi:hypothetical protein